MDAGILKIVGQVAGIGGLALGVLLLLYRDIIRKTIFPKLPAKEAYQLLRLITIAVWVVAIVGIGAWVYVARGPTATVEGRCGIAIGGNVSGSSVTNSGACPDAKP